MANEPKACPFCGGSAHQLSDGSATCTSCLDDDGWASEKDWNRRPIEDALRAEVAALKAEAAEWERRAERHLRRYHDTVQTGIDEIAALKAELAGYQEANHAVAVCRNHTNDIITRDGCVICDLARYTAPLTDNQVASLADDWALPSAEFKLIDASIRAAREGANWT